MDEEYKFIEEDSELEIRLNPREIQGYVLIIKNSERSMLFPRGTLEDLARVDRDSGKLIIENLVPMGYGKELFFEGTILTYDSIIAIATKAYLTEKEEYEKSIQQ